MHVVSDWDWRADEITGRRSVLDRSWAVWSASEKRQPSHRTSTASSGLSQNLDGKKAFKHKIAHINKAGYADTRILSSIVDIFLYNY